jgi:hypothetical protein
LALPVFSVGVLPVIRNRRATIRSLVLGLVATATGGAQESTPWHDPSKHTVQFVTVEEGTKRGTFRALFVPFSGGPQSLLSSNQCRLIIPRTS